VPRPSRPALVLGASVVGIAPVVSARLTGGAVDPYGLLLDAYLAWAAAFWGAVGSWYSAVLP
jgi:hypothetical protein